MREMLSRVGFNELLCWSAFLRRAERLILLSCDVIADDECHVLSSWVNPTLIHIQPAIR
jgi:hypothetical protein